jgi:hypothetical protein
MFRTGFETAISVVRWRMRMLLKYLGDRHRWIISMLMLSRYGDGSWAPCLSTPLNVMNNLKIDRFEIIIIRIHKDNCITEVVKTKCYCSAVSTLSSNWDVSDSVLSRSPAVLNEDFILLLCPTRKILRYGTILTLPSLLIIHNHPLVQLLHNL